MKTQGKTHYSKNLKQFSFSSVDLFWERDSDSWQPRKKMRRLPEVLSTTGISLLIYFYFYFFEPSSTPSLPRFFRSCVRRRGQPAIVQITLSALAFERAPARTGSRFISPGVGRILFWRVAPHVVALAQRDVRLQRWTGLLFHFKTTFDAGSVCNPGATLVYINRCYLLPLERSIHTLCSGGTFSCIFFMCM